MTGYGKFLIDVKMLQDDVILWNKIAGNNLSNKDLIPTYWNLILEESKELFTAENDIAELDAIVDLGVVGLFFNAVCYGAVEDFSGILSEYNLQKLGEGDHYEKIKEVLKIVTEKDYRYSADTRLFFITDWLALFYAASKKYDVIGAFREVMRSNFSKFQKLTENQIVIEMEKIEKAGRYSCLSVNDMEKYTVFFAEEDLREGKIFKAPKIIKPSTYSDPELAPFIK